MIAALHTMPGVYAAFLPVRKQTAGYNLLQLTAPVIQASQ
jgi:hypothetical protein